jgi:glutamate-ammonia-ligase adenylyltransferase
MVLSRASHNPHFILIALGKYGGGELTFGSDLDLLAVADEEGGVEAEGELQRVRRSMCRGGPLGPAFELDWRLRPHGDAGPMITTLTSLAAYHAGGGAQIWERQLLVRARVVGGPARLAARFLAWRDELLYAAPPSAAEEAAIWGMRLRIQRERDCASPPERAFKTGPGGLVDFEFLAQTLQLRHGPADPRLRSTGTRAALRALAEAGIIPGDAARRLLENYALLKRIEIMLRRDTNRAVGVLAATPEERLPLARWLGYRDEAAFWSEHVDRLRETRRLVCMLLGVA